MSMSPEIQELRRQGLTSTDAPAIVGVSDYKSPADIWVEKKHPDLVPARKDNPSLYWGTLHEETIANEYAKVTGQKIKKCGLERNAKIPWIMAQPDRLIEGKRKGLECKTASSFASHGWGKSGSDQIPHQYLVQVSHQMMTLDWREWDVAVLIGGTDFRIYHIFFDKELIKMIFDQEKEFYTRFIAGNEKPQFDWGATLSGMIKKKYPRATTGEKFDVDKNGDQTLEQSLTRLGEIKRSLKSLKAEEETQKTTIQSYMGENEILEWAEAQVRVTWKNTKDSVDIDYEAIMEKMLPHVSLPADQKQAIVKACTEEKKGGRRMLYKGPNGDDE